MDPQCWRGGPRQNEGGRRADFDEVQSCPCLKGASTMARKVVTGEQMAAVKKAARKVRLHFHAPPRCSNGSHDSKCGSRPEAFCASVKIGPVRLCSCGHT